MAVKMFVAFTQGSGKIKALHTAARAPHAIRAASKNNCRPVKFFLHTGSNNAHYANMPTGITLHDGKICLRVEIVA